MKFLITATPQNVPVPPDQLLALYQTAKEWMQARSDDGSLDCHYVFPERGGFAITNANSHEEVFDSIMDYPLNPRFTWEVKALCDWSHAYDRAIEALEKTVQQS